MHFAPMRQGKLPTPSAWFEGQLPNGTRASASLLLPPTTLTKFIERIYLVDQARAAAPPLSSIMPSEARAEGVKPSSPAVRIMMNACRLTMPQIRIVDGVDDLTRAPNLRRSTRVLDAGDNPRCQHLAVCTGQQTWRRILYRVRPLRSLRRVHPSRGSVEDADSARFELWHAARAETATNYLQCRTLGLGPAPHLGTLPFAETAPSVRSPGQCSLLAGRARAAILDCPLWRPCRATVDTIECGE